VLAAAGPTNHLKGSGIVSLMVANAINDDTDWFWHRPRHVGNKNSASPRGAHLTLRPPRSCL
jgi:hypothetical protein